MYWISPAVVIWSLGSINNAAEDAVALCKNLDTQNDKMLIEFNGWYMRVYSETTAEQIVNAYHEHIGRR